ncbi:hypothetical protein AVEN_185011-1 [Araneus ventricosus]|uniref:Uncharacterized protein n=1 Tax=Araneus ventricosus TaxID=182803 RepID=A0A4Y2BRH2_ARAVE|nr:hypothetical protein AVEN_185011-1 [Araneus ventricosus]
MDYDVHFKKHGGHKAKISLLTITSSCSLNSLFPRLHLSFITKHSKWLRDGDEDPNFHSSTPSTEPRHRIFALTADFGAVRPNLPGLVCPRMPNFREHRKGLLETTSGVYISVIWYPMHFSHNQAFHRNPQRVGVDPLSLHSFSLPTIACHVNMHQSTSF